MKVLVVYYSLEGNTRFIAECIASATGADMLELKPKNDIAKKGFMRYLWGGKQVVMNQKPELYPFSKDPADYDVLFIGTPVWAFTYAPALKTFFSSAKIKGKKIALFCCHAGSKINTIKNMRKALDGNDVISEIDFLDPLSRNMKNEAVRARKWAKQVTASIS